MPDCPQCGAPCNIYDNDNWGHRSISYHYIQPKTNDKDKEIHRLKSELGKLKHKVKRLEGG